jgi:hypothetical protein
MAASVRELTGIAGPPPPGQACSSKVCTPGLTTWALEIGKIPDWPPALNEYGPSVVTPSSVSWTAYTPFAANWPVTKTWCATASLVVTVTEMMVMNPPAAGIGMVGRYAEPGPTEFGTDTV